MAGMKNSRVLPAVITAGLAMMAFNLAATAAHANVSLSAKLEILPSFNEGHHRVIVTALARTGSTLEADRLIANGYQAQVRLFGDDAFFDQAIPPATGWTMTLRRDELGLRFHLERDVADRWLNEDLGRDEIYADVRLVDTFGHTARSAETNRVTGEFRPAARTAPSRNV
jgi:hypothetical protein